jgi:hypothetical protein
MDPVEKMLSDAVNDRNARAWEKREGRADCVAVRKHDPLWWVVCVLGDMLRDGDLDGCDHENLITSLSE